MPDYGRKDHVTRSQTHVAIAQATAKSSNDIFRIKSESQLAALLRLSKRKAVTTLLQLRAQYQVSSAPFLIIGLFAAVFQSCEPIIARSTSYLISSAQAIGLEPRGYLLTNKEPGHEFLVRSDREDAVIDRLGATGSDKISFRDLRITDAGFLHQRIQQTRSDSLVWQLGAQSPRITRATATPIWSDNLHLKPDRGGWIETFSDDFASFSWFAGDLQDHQGERGTWRTQFGYAGPNSLGSRTLTSNRELQIYVDPAFRGSTTKSLGLNPFRVADGVLEIIADQATENIQKSIWGYTYTSGLITTRFSFSQLYGLFEIRARLPKGRGLWPTFWLLPVDGTWPPEIDILEVLGHDPTMLYTSLHSKSSGKHTSETIMTRISDSSADFHTYSVDWEEDEIRWYFDDIEIGRKATPSDMHKPMYLLANLAVGGKWPGRPDASTRFPAIFAIDWIHAYKRNQSK